MTFAIPPMFCMARASFGWRSMPQSKYGDERRAMAAGGDVAHAQVADRDDAGALGDDRGLTDRERRARRDRLDRATARAGRRLGCRTRTMPDRLPGGGDEIDVVVRHAGIGDQAIRRAGEQLAEDEVEMADLLDGPERGCSPVSGSVSLRSRSRSNRSLMRCWISSGNWKLAKRSFSMRAPSRALPSMRTSTASMASTDVPDIRPMTTRDFFFGDVDETLDAVHDSRTSRRLPPCAARIAFALVERKSFSAITDASLTLPSASRIACTASRPVHARRELDHPHGAAAQFFIRRRHVDHQVGVDAAEENHHAGGERVEHELLRGAALHPRRAHDDFGAGLRRDGDVRFAAPAASSDST